MRYEDMIHYAIEEGFSDAAVIDTNEIVFDPTFRAYCEENLCGQYGVNYSCPPGCGSPEAMKQKILAHRKALVLQTIWEISDYSDMELIKPAKSSHNIAQVRLAKRLRSEGYDGYLVGASGCALCSPCKYALGQPCKYALGQPCSFPEYQFSCMSAYCIFVKKLTDKCGIEYDCGDGLLAFFGMYVFD